MKILLPLLAISIFVCISVATVSAATSLFFKDETVIDIIKLVHWKVRRKMFEQSSKFKNPFKNVNLSLVVIMLTFAFLHVSVQGINLPRGMIFPFMSMGLEVAHRNAIFLCSSDVEV